MRVAFMLSAALPIIFLGNAAAATDVQQDQDACMIDAQIVCGQFIPDRERVAHCLMANRERISPACREAIKRWK